MKKRYPSRLALQRFLAKLKGLFQRRHMPEPEPEDPLPSAGVRSPIKRGPLNRSGAVALAEPDEDSEIRAFQSQR